MQLVRNDGCEVDNSESEQEPIFCQPQRLRRSVESSSLPPEITAAKEDHAILYEEIRNLEEDEICLLVNADQPQCRICLDSGGEDLIAPCHCKGSQKYVHRICLDNWRSTKEGFAFSHCTECRAVFLIRANLPPDRGWLRLKFQLLVARDHAFIFITVQLVVACLGVMVYKLYGDELKEMFGYEEHPYGFYTMAGEQGLKKYAAQKCNYIYSHITVLAIMFVGMLYGFFIAIICGQRISERHYHVLAKQELTKEYVVQDRETSKDVPELDPRHISELRMFGLY